MTWVSPPCREGRRPGTTRKSTWVASPGRRSPSSTSRRYAAGALRRYAGGVDSFPQDVLELQAYFLPASPGQAVRAIPGAGLNVPIWVLGSSDFGARLAAELGLPYAFASHFAPDYLLPALD